MNIFSRFNYFMIRHNKKWFDKWLYALEHRAKTCSSSDILYVMECITFSKIHRMDEERINKINSILSFHCSFDELHLRRILNRYIDRVGFKKAKKVLKTLSELENDTQNVFIKDIIILYLNDNTFIEPAKLTVC